MVIQTQRIRNDYDTDCDEEEKEELSPYNTPMLKYKEFSVETAKRSIYEPMNGLLVLQIFVVDEHERILFFVFLLLDHHRYHALLFSVYLELKNIG